jgi:hypothetical protein
LFERNTKAKQTTNKNWTGSRDLWPILTLITFTNYSWIYFVKSNLAGQNMLADTVEIVASGKPEKMDNSIYLKSIFQLSQAQSMLQRVSSTPLPVILLFT